MTDTPSRMRRATASITEGQSADELQPRSPGGAGAEAKASARRRAKTAKRPPAPSEESAAEPTEAPERFDLDAPELYLNRELTWLKFNKRVLHEAQDRRTPLLERLKFLAIVGSNLDEFLMKRIGGLKQQFAASVHKLTVDGRTPQQQILECTEVIRELTASMRATLQEIRADLRQHDVVICRYDELSADEQLAMRQHYHRNIFPFVTPLAMDPAHPFPFLSNLSLNLLVTLQHPDVDEEVLARVKVPVGLGVPRFLQIDSSFRFVPLEEVMAKNLDLLFPDVEVKDCEFFRITRNANTERDEDTADDLLALIESELRDRKFAPIVRLEVSQDIRPIHRGMLAAELGLDERTDVYESDELLGMRDLMEIATLDVPELHDPDHHPVDNARLEDKRSIFHIIRDAGAILLHHPYESFTTSVERFVKEASLDPKVRAIKMTLYRTSASTKIIDYLVDAARNGKQVAVVVELKARFDEAANIRWASRLEEVGIHVNYGVVGLKTHSKVIQVLRMDYNGLRRYAHIGTGNYHAGTARIYSDLGLLTCDPAIGEDVTELFNYLTTGLKPSRRYGKLLTAPKHMKAGLLERIAREIECHSPERPGRIRFKCNALEDAAITKALYQAARAGVEIELIVRDTCRLRPGVPGLSESARVVSIVGRFLEHARIYYFQNGGEEEYFIGSADLMSRNLESRVEVLAPVEDPALRQELGVILDIQMNDQRSAWEMTADGEYLQRRAEGGEEGCQQALIHLAEQRYFEATRLRRRKPRGIARRISA
jgi:polyphosphate kinase